MSPLTEKLYDAVDFSNSREGFAGFLDLLADSANQEIEEWENKDLGSFLSALAVTVRGLEKSFDTPEQAASAIRSPSWEVFAGMLFVARCNRK